MSTISYLTPEDNIPHGVILNTDPDQGCYSGDNSAPVSGTLSSIALTLFTSAEKYLDTASPYISSTISITDLTSSTTLIMSNNSTGMIDFTGQCFSTTCTPLIPPSTSPPQFLLKPLDQTIRLNIQKVLKLEIYHPDNLTVTTSYLISNGGEGIVSVQNNSMIDLMATKPSHLGKHTLKITLTD